MEALLQPLLTHLIEREEQEPPTDGLRTGPSGSSGPIPKQSKTSTPKRGSKPKIVSPDNWDDGSAGWSNSDNDEWSKASDTAANLKPEANPTGLKKYHQLLNKIMTDKDLTASEQFSLPYLEKLYSKKTSTSASNVVSISMHSILAWGSVHPCKTEAFHDDTRFIWQKLEGETKANLKVLVKQDFEEICRNTEYKLCCHDLLVDTIVNVAFKPGDLNAAKPHLGFSILVFLPRKPQENVQLVEQGELMERASVITTADSLKVKLNALAILNTIDETLNTL